MDHVVFATKLCVEFIKMCLRDEHLGICACEIISRIARIVEVWRTHSARTNMVLAVLVTLTLSSSLAYIIKPQFWTELGV